MQKKSNSEEISEYRQALKQLKMDLNALIEKACLSGCFL